MHVYTRSVGLICKPYFATDLVTNRRLAPPKRLCFVLGTDALWKAAEVTE